MQQIAVAEVQRLAHQLDDVPIELRHRPRLRPASRAALVALLPEQLRRVVVEQVDVAAADIAIPVAAASARDDHDALRIDASVRGGPPQKRNPVEQLEPDLAD